MHDLEAFITALEEALQCSFTELDDTCARCLLDGTRTKIDVDGAGGVLRLSTPIEGAHDGLLAEDLLDLLTLNFPNDLCRGSFLAAGRMSGMIELFETVPLKGLAADNAATLVYDQIAAALAVGERIATRHAGRLI